MNREQTCTGCQQLFLLSKLAEDDVIEFKNCTKISGTCSVVKISLVDKQVKIKIPTQPRKQNRLFDLNCILKSVLNNAFTL